MKNNKLASLLLIGVLLLSSVIGIIPIATAAVPPTEPGKEDYTSEYGLLDSDTYVLYPYEETSIDIGFSKYGEMIDGDMGLGLKYDGVDVFANPAVPKELWCNGWVMDIHYTDGGYLKNTWAYALFSDRTLAGVEGDWQVHQLSKDASAVGDTHGGRRTNGYAITDPIRVIYDGPRKAIYLLKTTLYDKDPAMLGTPLVELTIQVVFDKVSKNVMEIKDVKRIDDNKMNGPFQIEFSQRAEWDIGLSSASESFTEFYSGIPTEYDKHPFYTIPYHADREVTFDLCQIIGEEDLVGYAAYWPPLISKWVTNADEVRRYGTDVDVPSLLSSMETYEQYVELPTSADQLVDPTIVVAPTGEIVIQLVKSPVEYPRGMGEWSEAPWVYKKDHTGGYAKLFQLITDPYTPGAWTWNPAFGPNGAVHIQPFQWTWGDEFVIVYKRVMEGHSPNLGVALECMPWEGFEVGTPHMSLGMYDEPDTPYVFGEWDFDLDMDHPENSTHQFRCVSVYGVTDYNNAVDPDQGTNNEFLIDKEVVYQLEEIFNPWDLKQTTGLDKFRWAQKGAMASTIDLTSHMCLEEDHQVWEASKWGYYCNDSEKVLAYTSSGQVLLVRNVDYTIDGNTITILDDHGADTYKVLYSTILDEVESPWHSGQFEWVILGENSHASDSLGAAMLSVGWSDWKNIEVWLSGLDIDSEIAPSIPMTMRKFADTETPNRLNYHYDHAGGDHRAAFKDDWCTPDDWDGYEEIHPKAISSSDAIIVGGPIASEAAAYFNDFTDAMVFTGYGDGFYAPGCWARTTQPYYQGKAMVEGVVADELWYDSVTVEDDIGHAIVSTYKDLNETVGFIVYGYTAEDTYYACYALRSGLLPWMQHLQDGVTTLIVEIDYSDLHPVQFHVKESLGRFTECTGFETDFKCHAYYDNLDYARSEVECEADDLGLCYKLIDIEWCAQLHPDP